LEHLAQIPDPRGRQGRRFSLSAMLATVVCAMLCGARGYEGIAGWIHAQEPRVWHWLGYFRKPPSANGFRDLLLAIPPADLEQAVRSWIAAVLGPLPADGPLQAIALDGKALRGTCAVGKQLVHLLSVLDHASGCVLSQMPVADKSNEIVAAPELLKTLVLQGRVVTADALHCQRQWCQQIVDSGGHYLVVVKDNQAELKEAIAAEFQAAFSPCDRAAAAG
jgi:hypothetical protein